MDRFSDDREALDFIASRIADEAQRDGVSFSQVERKMLYFSETAWTLPDIWDVNDEFDRDYDQDVYEKKISHLIKEAVSRARKQQREEFEAWTAAIRRLSKEDRYLLVMVKQAGLGPTLLPPGGLWKRWITGGAIVALFGSLIWLISKFFPDSGVTPAAPRGYLGSAFWAAMVCVLVVLGITRFLVGARKFGDMSTRALEWIFGASKRGR
jgi:hypothetical protein